MIKNFFKLIISVAFFISCNTKTNIKESESEKSEIVISGSDTELPIVKQLAEVYCKTNTLVTINVSGGGTSVGFKDILDDKSTIANASREITDKENALASEKKLELLPIMFAVDAVVIITNSKLGINSLSIHQVAQILSGQLKNWKEVGGPDKAITLYGRDSTSGTQLFLKNKFKIPKYADNIITYKESSEVVTAVEKNLYGIGYSSLGYILDVNGKPNGKVWSMPLSIDSNSAAVSPLQVSAVIKGEYPLTRPLYQYIKQKPNGAIKNFILFELSGDGYKIIKKFGYFPINDYQVEINKLNGIYP